MTTTEQQIAALETENAQLRQQRRDLCAKVATLTASLNFVTDHAAPPADGECTICGAPEGVACSPLCPSPYGSDTMTGLRLPTGEKVGPDPRHHVNEAPYDPALDVVEQSIVCAQVEAADIAVCGYVVPTLNSINVGTYLGEMQAEIAARVAVTEARIDGEKIVPAVKL